MMRNLKHEWETGKIISVKRLADAKKEELMRLNPNAKGCIIAERIESFFYNEIGIYNNEIEKYIEEITEQEN